MALGSMPFSYLNIVSNSQMSLATSNLATSPSPEHAQVVRQNHFFSPEGIFEKSNFWLGLITVLTKTDPQVGI